MIPTAQIKGIHETWAVTGFAGRLFTMLVVFG
jgi:hypothetical protein